jgi:uncharacterized protein (TIGR02598 family)
MAIGVISFALVGLMGLLIAGMGNFRDCLNRNGRAIVIQAVRAEIPRIPFDSSAGFQLVLDEAGLPLSSASDPERFFIVTGTCSTGSGTNSDPLGGQSKSLRIWNVEVKWRPFTESQKAAYSISQVDMAGKP